MDLSLLLSVTILVFNTGCLAEVSVFVQTGKSLQLVLATEQTPEFDILFWLNEKSENIVTFYKANSRIALHPSYKDRVKFDDKTLSLTLKNTQKNDNGVYTARTTEHLTTDISIYRVFILDAVDAPVLTETLVSSCNFTCTVGSMTLGLIYDGRGCSKEVNSSEINHLRLSCRDDVIFCNHSNPVSWKETELKIHTNCSSNSEYRKQAASFQSWVIVLVVLLVVILVLIGFYHIKKNTETSDGTIYSEVDEKQVSQKPVKVNNCNDINSVYDTPHQKSSDNPANLSTIYSLIQPSKPPGSEPGHTIYAKVNKSSGSLKAPETSESNPHGFTEMSLSIPSIMVNNC